MLVCDQCFVVPSVLPHLYHVSFLSLIILSDGIIRYSYSNINKHNINVHLNIIYFNTTVLLFSLNLISLFLPGKHPLLYLCFSDFIYIYNFIQ